MNSTYIGQPVNPPTVKLLGNRVLVAPLPQATKSAGGIHLAQRYQDDQMQFRVLAVGPGKANKKGVLVPPEVKPGDQIVAGLYHTHTILEDGRRVIDASEILAVVVQTP